MRSSRLSTQRTSRDIDDLSPYYSRTSRDLTETRRARSATSPGLFESSNGIGLSSRDAYNGDDEGSKFEAGFERGGVEGVLSGALFGGDPKTREKVVSFGVASAVIRTLAPAFMEWLNQHSKLRKLFTSLTVLWLVYRYVLRKWESIRTWMMSYVLTSIKVDRDDRLYRSIDGYVRQQASSKKRASFKRFTIFPERTIRAETGSRNNELVLHPDSNLRFFRFQGKWYIVTYEARDLRLWCFGWSTQALEEVALKIHKKHSTQRKVEQIQHLSARRVPDEDFEQNSHRRGAYPKGPKGGFYWATLASIDRRSLESVLLPKDVKTELTTLVEEYFSDEHREFYRQRTLPRRLGFLLYGPPGCGKTSFITALASEHNLTIYQCSLRDKGMNDTVLVDLFKQVGDRCLVLLEDIDSAGIGREFEDETDEETDNPSKVTYSGLLNVTDGCNAPTGHILVMTTNNREMLDDALIREGRVDMQVEFKLACKEQIRDMFFSIMTPIRKSADYDSQQLAEMAERFASTIPEYTFSPAAIQQFCKINRRDPEAALGKAEEWAKNKSSRRPFENKRKNVENILS